MPNSRLLRVIVAVGGGLAVCLSLAHAMRSEGSIGNGPLIDDTFYALAVSRNLALGHGLSVDGVTPTSGFQPLWVFMCAALSLLVGADRVATIRAIVVLSCAVWVAFAWVVSSQARRRAEALGMEGKTAGLCAACLVLGSYAIFGQFHNGLETGTTLLLMAAAVQCLNEHERNWQWIGKTGLVLSLLCYARLDAVVLVLAYGAVQLVDVVRHRRICWQAWAPCILAGVALLPWLIRGMVLDGHLMPTSGRAESCSPSVSDNVGATINAVRWWLFPAMSYLPQSFPLHGMLNKLMFLGGAGVAGAAVLASASSPGRRLVHWRGDGTLALLAHVAFLVTFYTFYFAAPWFLPRYLSPLIIVLIPLLAVGSEQVVGKARLLVPIGLTLVVGANAVAILLSLLGRVGPTNTLFSVQKVYVERQVPPDCVVGAGQSGTLGYFRDRVVNLDGKVNSVALEAIIANRLVDYVAKESKIDVFVDWKVYVPGRIDPTQSTFYLVEEIGCFQVWVRRGREVCVGGNHSTGRNPGDAFIRDAAQQ